VDARSAVETPIWRGIVKVADQISAAAIVIGSRGLTGIHEVVAGSLSHEVAVRAGRPVLVVPPLR
jgi:nucleotide-binding universal stress UspA family protein